MNERIAEQGTAPLGKLLLRYSLPAIVGTMVFALYGFVDMAFIGSLVSTDAVAALNVSMPVVNIMIAFGMFVTVGCGTILSIRLGEKNRSECEVIVGNAFSLLLIVSTILSIIFFITLTPMLRQFGASEVTLPIAKNYMAIILLGMPFNFLAYGMNNLVRAEGNAKFAMIVMLLGSGSNIILDPIFIHTLKLGVQGAAWATVLANCLSASLVVLYYITKRSALHLHWKNLIPRKKIFFDIFPIGLAPFLMQLAMSIVIIIMNRQLSFYGGDVAVSVGGVVSVVAMMILFPVMGLSQGIQPIIGYNYGAKNKKRVKNVLFLGMGLATIVCVVGELFLIFFPQAILSLFENKDTTEQFTTMGIKVFYIAPIMIWIVGFQIIATTFFQSINRARIAIFLSLLRQVILLMPLLFILPHFLGLRGVWLVWPLSDTISALTFILFLRMELKRFNSS